MIKRKTLLCSILTIMAACFLALAALLLVPKASASYFLTSDVVNTLNMKVYESQRYVGNVGDYGFALKGGKNSKAEFATRFVGKSNFKLRAYTANGATKNVALRITDGTNPENTFDVIFQASASSQNVSVKFGGEQHGLYYFSSNEYGNPFLTGVSKAYNATGAYTIVNGEMAQDITFDAQTMQVFVKDDSYNYMVWDLTKSVLDGKKVNAPLSAFENYTVSVVYLDATANDGITTIVYEVNGTKLDSQVIETTPKTDVYVEAVNNGKVGEDYLIPTPHVACLTSAYVSENVKVCVLDGSSTEVYNEFYTTSASFVPTTAGKYVVNYYLNGALKLSKRFEIKATDEFYGANYIIDGSYADEYVLNQTISILSASATAEILNNSNAPQVYVTLNRDGAPVSGYENLNANGVYEYTFTAAGNYSIVYSIDGEYSNAVEVIEFLVADAGASFSNVQIANDLAKGDVLTIPECVLFVGQTSVPAKSKLVYPSGACYVAKKQTLVDAGKYTVVYTATYEGVAYTKNVEFYVTNDVASLFSSSAISSVTAGQSKLTDAFSGVLVTSKNTDVVSYEPTINLKGKTKDDVLLEMAIDPNTIGTADFRTLSIYITDIYDESNYIHVFVRSPLDSSLGSGSGSYVSAAIGNGMLKGRGYGGSYDAASGITTLTEKVFQGGENGYAATVSFKGTVLYRDNIFGVHDMSKNFLQLYYDDAEKAIYLNESWSGVCYNQDVSNLLLDFDDEKYVSEKWKGFTTGEVKMSFSIGEMVNASGTFVLMNIAGTQFGNPDFKDETAPVISTDADVLDGVPLAAVGKSYKVFDSKAFDNIDGEVGTSVKVYHSATKTRVNVDANGCFVPKYSGVYDITYTATDGFGNLGQKIVQVNAVSAIPEIVVGADTTSLAGTLFCGNYVEFPELNVSGGAGYVYDVKKQVFLGQEELTAIGENGFIPEKDGAHKIKYTVTDYVGNVKVYEASFNVSVSTKPVLQGEIYLPLAMLEGFTYELPIVEAKDYADGGKAIKPIITAKYDDGASAEIVDNVITVASKTSVTVTYAYNGKSGSETVSRAIPIACPTSGGSLDMTKYFIIDGSVTATSTPSSVDLVATGDGEALFANALYSGDFDAIFSLSKTSKELESFEIHLIDEANHSNYIVFKITKLNGVNQSNLSINGGSDIPIKANFNDGMDNLVINYVNAEKAVYDGDGNKIYVASKNALGDDFNGFSDRVYMKIKFNGVTGAGATVSVTELLKQTMTYATTDEGAPLIVRDGYFNRTPALGETVTLSKATAFDVLSDVNDVILTVRNNIDDSVVEDVDGVALNGVLANKDYVVRFDTAGYYSVTYSVKDCSSQQIEGVETILVSVFDKSNITIDFGGAIKSEYKVGESIDVSSFEVGSNVDWYDVYLINANGEYVRYYDTVTFDKAGDYKLRFMVYDYEYYVKLYDFEIKVR